MTDAVLAATEVLDPPADSGLTLRGRPTTADDIRAAFLASKRGKTEAAYRSDLDQWWRWCATHHVDPLAAHRVHVDVWVRSMEGLAAATVARKVSSVRGFYEYAVDDGHLERSPVPAKNSKLPMRKVSTRSQTLGPDREQGAALLKAAARAGTREYAVIATLLHEGLRVSELLGIRLRDLDRHHGHHVVWVLRKGGEQQELALAPLVVDAIDRHRTTLDDDGPDALLFPALDRFAVDRLVKRLSRYCGIDKTLSPHSLRHACCTAMLDAGVPIRDVQVFMGHASPTTTARYDLGRDQLDRSPVYAINGVFA